MKIKYYLAIWVGKILSLSLRFLQRGATALPGYIASMIDRNALKSLMQNLKYGSIIVTGTNGKTTTARIVSTILDRNGYSVVSNISGSNLERGLLSTLLEHADWQGKVEGDIAVLEIDEAELANIIDKVYCRQLVVTNFFRDQLDRYGELNKLRELVGRAISKMNTGTKLILNADDPLVRSLDVFASNDVEIKYFGMNEKFGVKQKEEALDVNECVICHKKLVYKNYYYSHLGDYNCSECGFARVKPNLTISELRLLGMNGSEFVLEGQKYSGLKIAMPIPGFYNLYNILAALLAVENLEIELNLIVESMVKFKPVFGRFEKFNLAGKDCFLMLSKNPTGFNEMIKTVLNSNERVNLILILNDNYADGKDISWIWDVDFEKLKDRINWVAVGGARAEELMLRLKYANLNMQTVGLEKDLSKLVQDIKVIKNNEPIFVLATYTGMFDFRKILENEGIAAKFWKEKI
jgi:UDP-N-acetylmuramyl tripeptide synthase